jgi:light-regulated signal transduction histidine kinase (bacteriophytochrome)
MQNLLLNRMTNHIRQSLELQEILSATVAEVRSFLDTDRVKIYRFEADGTGQVIAESVNQNRLPSLLNLYFPAGDIPPHAREMFVKARQRSIVDIPAQRITLSRIDYPQTTGDLTVEDVCSRSIEDILQRPVDPCHVEYLTAMGVQSSLVVPILYHQNLWGLLVSHHSQPKAFSEESLQIVQMVTDQVSIAIAQSHLFTQTREKARREAFLNQISTLLHSPLRIQQILQIVLEAVVKATQGAGGRLYLTPTDIVAAQLYTCGVQPSLSGDGQPALLEDYPFWQQLLSADGEGQEDEWKVDYSSDGGFWMTDDRRPTLTAIADIYQEAQLQTLAPHFRPTRIRSLLVMPLQYGKQILGVLSIFRNEIDTDIVWAGRFDLDERNNRVRDSFEAWRELKQGIPREWTTEEVELVRSIGTHLTMAVMQNRLYQYEHEQRLLVEMRNRELNTARTVAEEASRLKSDFLASTSHELRTPLAATLNYLKLLQEGFYDNEEELKEYIQVAYQSAENLVAIINDVLDIAKIEAGRMTVNWETVKLRPLLEEQRNLFHLESRRKGIELIIECEVDSLYGDKMRLRQVLTNLLSNAFKFTDKGQVHLKVIERVGEPLVEISVSDSGIGIDISKRDILFEPFVQANGSVKRRYGGTGLGLAICKRLVELMGGQIWLESPGIGQGTTVTFTLPNKTAL